MTSKRMSARKKSAMAAFCGMSAGLSVGFMLLGGVIPVATYAVPLFCGLLLLPVFIEFGRTAAWTTYLAAALLALILDIDKEAAFFYLFLGYYPIIKWRLDRIKSKPVRFGFKFSFFTGAIVLMYGLLTLVFPVEAVLEEFKEMGAYLSLAFLLAFDLCLFLYDRLLMIGVVFYGQKIRPRMKFWSDIP